ncbi:alpha-ribazole phosphatase [Angustibacter peucedani]
MPISVVLETHSTTLDNESGHATGWGQGELSDAGRQQARELGGRRRDDGIAAVFTSDLARATETVRIAFEGSDVPVLHDWRLRECDYGSWNGAPRAVVLGDRSRYLDQPYPGGESWRQAVDRVAGFLDDLPSRWSHQRVLVVGHVATRWALDHVLLGRPLEQLAGQEFEWQPGWEYSIPPAAAPHTTASADVRQVWEHLAST